MFNILLCSYLAFFIFKSHEQQLYSWQSGEYVSGKLKCIATWKINWKAIFIGINWLF